MKHCCICCDKYVLTESKRGNFRQLFYICFIQPHQSHAMYTPFGQITYCSNIHPGETWPEHTNELRAVVPKIASFFPQKPFNLGLRLAERAADFLKNAEQAQMEWKSWLVQNQITVTTMNGFPYGSFHGSVVKDLVHAPDWTSEERVIYTQNLALVLAQIMPDDERSGGISTSPLSYKFWWKSIQEKEQAYQQATENILSMVVFLQELEQKTGKSIHIDIEPEPDGLIENMAEFLDWYSAYLLPLGVKKWGSAAEESIRKHIQLCFDVCHVAVGFEQPEVVINQLEKHEIQTGKIQVSSALSVDWETGDFQEKKHTLAQFNEPTYLHQVVAKRPDGTLDKYRDLDWALADFSPQKHTEWRVHFHVPIFLESYGCLGSTQATILETLAQHKRKPFTQLLEIETYTWGVLPKDAQKPLATSIQRELDWLLTQLNEK